MKLIVNADRKWGIGKNGGMLFHIPDDLRFFREKTTGGAVIMGRATLESLPGSRPLKDRLNIVLTRGDALCDDENLHVCRSVAEAVKDASCTPAENVYVIGGEQVYAEMLHLCDEAYVTRVDEDGHADRFAPDLDKDPEWTLAETLGAGKTGDGLKYEFCRYKRVQKPKNL